MSISDPSSLPPPPRDRTGFPWTETSPPVPPTRPDGSPWPRITIITPSYNQGEFIEETIRSILLQGYPNLEYIIMDGGSTDRTLEVIRKYERFLSYWESVSDKGQSNAINKGLAHCTGELFNWINSDDTLFAGALHAVALAHAQVGDFAIICGPTAMTREDGSIIWFYNNTPIGSEEGLGSIWPNQPGGFIPARLVRSTRVREDLSFTMDVDLWMRLWSSVSDLSLYPIENPVATYRLHDNSKTSSGASPFSEEEFCLRHDMMQCLGFFREPNPLTRIRNSLPVPITTYTIKRPFDRNEIPQYFCNRLALDRSILRDVIWKSSSSETQFIHDYMDILRWLAAWRARHPGKIAPADLMLMEGLKTTRCFDIRTALQITRLSPTHRNLGRLGRLALSHAKNSVKDALAGQRFIRGR
ncbi:glycosyltransferase family 2 protein [Acuticoccus yangtzensis]|uniref:glycosyltransferase family 2 protein n=1 Tax=Acuticoccus yangtzensis TaxID=1443441 RepID=UPI0009496D87|nr:glycosyltransferase family 2 protein [Acuticoccus yangtzensis]